jgi:hypothetical protein
MRDPSFPHFFREPKETCWIYAMPHSLDPVLFDWLVVQEV